ncbi:MAG TPA: hypothetical protein VFZ04_03060 [Longimicrobiales bacterium]
MGMGKKLMWGLAGMTASKMARAGTRRALHTSYPAAHAKVRVRPKFKSMLMLAAGAGVVLALADVMKEQKHIVMQRDAAM